MKSQILFLFSKIPILFLIPYLMVMVFQGSTAALANRLPDVETCLPVILAQEIGSDHEKEAVKAQAVIARTNVYRRMEEGESLYDILKETGQEMDSPEYFWIPAYAGKLQAADLLQGITERDEEIYEEAVQETEDLVLLWNGELKLIPYHELSAGTTRNGAEALRDDSYTYLKSVDSSVDKTAADYLTSTYIAASQMPKDLQIAERDSAGYVLSLRADGKLLEGEAFCQGMNLASSNFTIQKVGERYRFLCKGKGHGLGFSQYGGNEMAKEGAVCQEILEAYFPEMEILKKSE